jgi:hypothetical protein
MWAKRRRRRALWNEIRRVARDDLERVAEEIAARDGSTEDAYYSAVGLHQRACERLATARKIEDVRAVGRLAAQARAALAGAADTAPCFFDPAHRPSVHEVLFAPEGGPLRYVPACDACAEEVDAGRLPPLRRVIVDGYPQPYWRSPAHAGYIGRGSADLDDLLVRGGATVGLHLAGGLLDVWI